MNKEIASEVWKTILEYGQSDHNFKLGETIKYSPSEIRDILVKHDENTEESKKDVRPTLSVKPGWLVAQNRIKELTEGIQRYSDNVQEHYLDIYQYAREIEYQCDIVDYLYTLEVDK